MTNFLTEILQEYGNAEKCKIRDPSKVELILQGLISGGSKKLQVITDFDMTLTRFHKDGLRCTSCHGIVDNSPLMPEEYRQRAKITVEKYYPIEIDHEMSTEEKIPHMIKWYRDSENLLIEYHLSKPKIEEMVKTGRALLRLVYSGLYYLFHDLIETTVTNQDVANHMHHWLELRDCARDVLSLLNDHKVPCLVFSAGLGDVLEAILHRDNAYFPNMKVISNFLEFNDEGLCTNIKEPLIHMFNKNEDALVDNPKYFEELSHRHNALVLGDSLGDVQMGKGLHNPESILKIGFLNDKIDERLNSFLESFDIVLLDDQTFKFVEIIVKKILNSGKNGK